MQEDDNPQLKKIYETFKTEMEKLENFRQNHLNKINDLILPVTNCYPNKLKEIKEYLKNYEEAKKTKEKLEKSALPILKCKNKFLLSLHLSLSNLVIPSSTFSSLFFSSVLDFASSAFIFCT